MPYAHRAGLPVSSDSRPSDRTAADQSVDADSNGLISSHGAAVLARSDREFQLRLRIEEQASALEAAELARQEALSKAHARGAFIAATSHELRTPLNAIIGFSEVLQREMFGPLGNERYLQYANIIHDSGARLLELINDILDISKLDAGKLELQLEQVEILGTIVACVRTVEPLAAKSQLGIRVIVHDGIDWLDADSKRLHQMLLNLLSNAIKFTEPGGEVCVVASRRSDRILISVSDTGIGVAENDIPKILEPFGQVDSKLAKNHTGTGLGLPLTKELAELHGGALQIESMPGLGTTVTIELPSTRFCRKEIARSPADRVAW